MTNKSRELIVYAPQPFCGTTQAVIQYGTYAEIAEEIRREIIERMGVPPLILGHLQSPNYRTYHP